MKTKSKPKSQSKPKSKGCRRAAPCSPDFTSRGVPVVTLGTKLEYLRSCIIDGHFEDAMGHLDDLRDSIHLRARLIGIQHHELTPDGLKSLRYTEATGGTAQRE